MCSLSGSLFTGFLLDVGFLGSTLFASFLLDVGFLGGSLFAGFLLDAGFLCGSLFASFFHTGYAQLTVSTAVVVVTSGAAVIVYTNIRLACHL